MSQSAEIIRIHFLALTANEFIVVACVSPNRNPHRSLNKNNLLIFILQLQLQLKWGLKAVEVAKSRTVYTLMDRSIR